MTVKSMSLFFSSLLLAPVSFAVISGQEIDSSVFPATVQYVASQPSGKQTSCSGTFVTVRTMVTAAHCLEKASEVTFTKSDGAVVQTTKIFPSPEYSRMGRRSSFDVGVIIFDEPAHEATAEMDFDFKPSAGKPIEFVGFGSGVVAIAMKQSMLEEIQKITGLDVFRRVSGLKRYGRNRLVVLKDLLDGLTFLAPIYGPRHEIIPTVDQEVSAVTSGDSGGAFYANHRLVGVVSGALWFGLDSVQAMAPTLHFKPDPTLAHDLAVGALLSNAKNKSWVEQHLQK